MMEGDRWRLPPARHAGALVYAKLRELIVNGDLADGTPVSEAGLAARMGVSRTPVREAMARLSMGGLLRPGVARGPAAGMVVADPLADLEALLVLREVIEGAAARLAAQRATAAQIGAIAALAAQSRDQALEAFAARSALNTAFHATIIAAAQAPVLAGLAETYWGYFDTPRVMRALSAEETQAALEDHDALADAIARRDGAAAEAIARAHLRRAYGGGLGG